MKNKRVKPYIGSRIRIEDLQINDLFYMDYGFEKIIFRVHKILQDEGILAHSVKWCKGDSIVVKFNTDRNIHYAGKLSRIRAWMMI